MIGHYWQVKITEVNFLENPLLAQMGSFGPIVAKTYARLHHRICSKDFVQTLQDDRAQKAEKNLEGEKFPKKSSFASNAQCWYNHGL